MSMAIFRVSGIKATSDLQGIGKHNVERKSETNMDIDHSRSDENITLKSCTGNYNQMFDYVTGDLKKQHDEQMKTTRISRQKSFTKKINDDKADVACEFLMSATPEFFHGKSRDEIQKWAEKSLDFVTEEIGIDRDNVLHAVVHMDEKTPHLHVVAVPLVEKYDGRRKEDVLAISRKHFIKTREDMSTVQTKYVEHLNENGFDLERGIEKSGAKHLDVARYKIQETNKELDATAKHLDVARDKIQDTNKKLDTTEKILLEKKEELSEINEIVNQAVKAIPKEKNSVPFLKMEVETEVIQKILGKSEIIEKETENYVLTPNQFKAVNEKVNAAVAIQDDYERLRNTDIVKENEKYQEIIRKAAPQMEKQNKTIKKLLNENNTLKERVSSLTLEIKATYQSVKEFVGEHAKDPRAFKIAFKNLIDKVQGKTLETREKKGLEPERGEFEKIHRNEVRREQDNELSR